MSAAGDLPTYIYIYNVVHDAFADGIEVLRNVSEGDNSRNVDFDLLIE